MEYAADDFPAIADRVREIKGGQPRRRLDINELARMRMAHGAELDSWVERIDPSLRRRPGEADSTFQARLADALAMQAPA